MTQSQFYSFRSQTGIAPSSPISEDILINLCPISAMEAYLESRSPLPNSGPLFTFQCGSFLTRGRFTSETRLLLSKGGLDSSEFASHSFRIGAATTAASANLLPWLIKVFGR